MVSQNEDVLNGIANGTVCKFRKVVLKQGVELEKIRMHGYWADAPPWQRLLLRGIIISLLCFS
jgi:hypothetical protein